MQKLPDEIIDRILMYTNTEICIKLKRYHPLLSRVSMDEASNKGYLELVKYLHISGKKCTSNAMGWAAGNGHLEVVKY
ncbi:MAG: ankyrin repeat protein, partial [Alphaproteobacteria bacterium]